MQSLHPAPVVVTPRRALMGKDVWVIIVKNIDHIGIAKRLKKEHVFVVIPIRPGRDNGVLRRVLPDHPSQLGFHAVPAIAIANFRLVQDFEEDAFGIIRSVVPSKYAPEISKTLD